VYPYENANMSELMKKCDIAVAACGSTLYELCAMKVPTIGIILADNQIEVGKMMADKGLLSDIFYMDRFEKEKFIESVNNLIENKNLRNEMQKKQELIVDINGVINLVNKIKMLNNKY
ncbi:glycosyltransferase, partial [uncultured Clostridium sp.]|uniref:glycosyltransferase n=1 Tax=uncultured Clostridium sp. TaxID=59620 RepID=UPI0025EFD785